MTPPVRLRVRTREIDAIEDLLPYTSPHAPLAWLRRGDGIVGIGDVIRIEAGGHRPAPGGMPRTTTIAQAWRQAAEHAEIDDEVQLPGTGLVAFGALTFDEDSTAASTLVVPRVAVGRREGRSWITQIASGRGAAADAAPEPTPYGPYWAGTLGPGALAPDGYQDAVRRGLAAIATGEVGKVVLARDLVGSVPSGADLRRLARSLSTGYPDTWTFAVDGIIGASPETLVTVRGGTATARVLAGTAPRGADADGDGAASLALATSAKDLDEHQYAVQSVLAALRPFAAAVAAAEQPFTLKLPNLWHLATDLEAELGDGATALDLVAALHPTAAVAGTPTNAALALIRRIEPFDRGRYAGPVGWVDAHGDGEWAIALRCAQFGSTARTDGASWSIDGRDGIPVTAHAGAGIVTGSDPETELLETRVKFRPIVDALA
ncbi:MAG: isochorismate synthase MenF [Microbacterium sp.]|uniref:isochorismate synthase n=1 Tax=Microbacterium sp. TaxID=51671 RepID=UPI003A86950E